MKHVGSLIVVVCLAVGSLWGQTEAETPSAVSNRWIEEARAMLPKYDGDQRDFLTAAQKRNVQAASHLFSAALTLAPDSPHGLWWKGHAEVLLGEDLRNRDQEQEAEVHYTSALATFDRALEVQPESYWAWYARAMARYRLDQPFLAIEDFDKCVEHAQAVLDSDRTGEHQDARFIRYKARWWRADARMHTLEFDLAREEFQSFYADNGGNQWDLGFSVAETYLSQRDFAGASKHFTELITRENFADFDGIHFQLGYLRGLSGDLEAAHDHIARGLERERVPGLYGRLWLWILAPTEKRAEAEKDLRFFLDHAPAELTPWDGRLGRFMLGEGAVGEFVRAARAERSRRMIEAIPLDDLMCEVYYYAGLRHLGRGEMRETTLLIEAALDARPRTFKWEWAFARKILADLNVGDVPSEKNIPNLKQMRVVNVWLHRVGSPSPVPLRENALQVGDWLQGVFRLDGEEPVYHRWLVQ